MLAGQHSCEACSSAKFPGKSALAAGPIERAHKVLFGGRLGIRLVLPRENIPLDAQQLCDIPAFVAGFAASDGRADGFEPHGDLASRAEASRQLAEQQQEAGQKPGFPTCSSPARSTRSPAPMSPRLAIT